MPVSIIGTNGCGKTVFLGLLYESLVRFTNARDNVGPGELRINMDPQFTKALGEIRLDLMSGRWPSKERRVEISRFMIELGFRRRSFLGMSPSSNFDKMMVKNADLDEKDIRLIKGSEHFLEAMSIKNGGGSLDQGSFSESFLDVLDSFVIVLLIDASKVAVVDDIEGERLVKEADAFNATFLNAMIMNRKRQIKRGSGSTRIFPMIFLTKFDRMGVVATESDGLPISFKDEGIDEEKVLSSSGRASSRMKLAEEIMRKHYPNTMKVLDNYQADAVRFQKVEIFLSGLRTEMDETGAMIPATIVDHGQVSLDYAYGEYASFIRQIGKVTSRSPDDISEYRMRRR